MTGIPAMTEQNNEVSEAQVTAEAKANAVIITTIPANNPSAEDMTAIIEHLVTSTVGVTVASAPFTFKKSKDKETGLESIRETVNLPVPVPNAAGIIAIIEAGGNGLELLTSAMRTIVANEAREIIHSDAELGAEDFPYEKLDWTTIANKPKANRGGGIPKEVWEAFAVDYIAVMMEAAKKTKDQATNAATILKGKLSAVRTNKPVLIVLMEQLAVYAENTEQLETYEAVVTFLLEKGETLMNVTDAQLLAGL